MNLLTRFGFWIFLSILWKEVNRSKKQILRGPLLWSFSQTERILWNHLLYFKVIRGGHIWFTHPCKTYHLPRELALSSIWLIQLLCAIGLRKCIVRGENSFFFFSIEKGEEFALHSFSFYHWFLLLHKCTWRDIKAVSFVEQRVISLQNGLGPYLIYIQIWPTGCIYSWKGEECA